ncbi:HGGxSTG domain-containing protein [Brachymonas denitrificans]|uniref:HGGxSTG domain-containing protein n=1 Tax=Brachymonas denitrificans TaxID=28220 RepID=UPI002AFE33AD|nr:HGGxSTG domain-containing protein [Brachymonas denitrificans]
MTASSRTAASLAATCLTAAASGRTRATNGKGCDVAQAAGRPHEVWKVSARGRPLTDDERRKLWRCWCKESREASERWAARGYGYPAEPQPPMPPEVVGLACGAKTRAGTPCKLTSIYASGRCKLHGGLSTGPKTPEGRAQSARNGRQGKRKQAG